MNWTKLDIEHVITRNVIYFDKQKSKTCEKICKTLHIDCFPDIKQKAYWILNSGEWVKRKLNYKLNNIEDSFNENLLGLFEKNDSHIIFTTNFSFINGVIHFTNYENEFVYSNLYRNLNTFEKNLRNLIYHFEFSDDDYLKFLTTHKIPRTKGDYKKYLENRVLKLKTASDKRPFEHLYLSELMEFVISSYHSPEELLNFNVEFLNDKIPYLNKKEPCHILVNKLRNFIMHHDNISGESVFSPHNFDEFKSFFLLVLNFKKTFDLLAKRIAKVNLISKESINSLSLDMIETMNAKEIKNYFYSQI